MQILINVAVIFGIIQLVVCEGELEHYDRKNKQYAGFNGNHHPCTWANGTILPIGQWGCYNNFYTTYHNKCSKYISAKPGAFCNGPNNQYHVQGTNLLCCNHFSGYDEDEPSIGGHKGNRGPCSSEYNNGKITNYIYGCYRNYYTVNEGRCGKRADFEPHYRAYCPGLPLFMHCCEHAKIDDNHIDFEGFDIPGNLGPCMRSDGGMAGVDRWGCYAAHSTKGVLHCGPSSKPHVGGFCPRHPKGTLCCSHIGVKFEDVE